MLRCTRLISSSSLLMARSVVAASVWMSRLAALMRLISLLACFMAS